METTIRIELQKSKLNKKGVAPLRILYQLYGNRKVIPTGLRLNPVNWDNHLQRAIYVNERTARRIVPGLPFTDLPRKLDIDNVNNTLAGIVEDLRQTELKLTLQGKAVKQSEVIEAHKSSQADTIRPDDPKNLVYDYIERYCEEQRSTVKETSIKIYQALERHLKRFSRVKRRPISFENMDISFFKSFQTFLLESSHYVGKGRIVKNGLTNTTVAKQLSTLKTILNYAGRTGLDVNAGYKDFKIKREPLPVIALTNGEFLTFYNADLSKTPRLEKVRDLFCFSCVTGLRYSDLMQLAHNNIQDDFIKITVFKTRDMLEVPLNRYAKEILSRYSTERNPLPVISNQKYNSYLKELAEKLGIDSDVEIVRFRGAERVVTVRPKFELIGTHTGRKTFCTLSLERGMSAEQVMSISGHKDYRSFKRYVNITREVKRASILRAWDIPEMKVVKHG